MSQKDEQKEVKTETKWHTKTIEEVFSEFEADKDGLTSQEVQTRLEKYGPNALPESKPDGLVKIFFKQFQNPLIYLLLVAGAILLFLKEWIDGGIIGFVLLFNAVAGTIQTGRARNTLLALRKMTKTRATVLRNGEEVVIPDKDVVPGDILILQEGEKVSADARLIWSKNLRINEAILTGEPDPSGKDSATLSDPSLRTPDQINMVFKGTNVVGGQGRAMVVRTGTSTVIGAISKKISTVETEVPLQADIRRLTHVIIVVVLLVSASIFLIGMSTGRELEEIFALSVAVVVSAVPEGLPIVMTLLLASGVWRMSKRNVLVKRLQAVEALGEAKVIAVDKTGTITKNELVIQSVYSDGGMYEVSGIGYQTVGDITRDGKKIHKDDSPELSLAVKIAAISADARLTKEEGSSSWKVAGDPTEAAMLVLAQKSGITRKMIDHEWQRLDEIPFDSKLKYHAVLTRIGDENLGAVTGAPEIVLDLCSDIMENGKVTSLSEAKKTELTKIFEEMSRKGLRVLSAATMKKTSDKIADGDINNLVFVAFYGMKDALREEVAQAMKDTSEAGIRVIMITGDHKITAEAIAREAGIFRDGDEVLTDEEIEKMTDEELSSHLPRVSVFARITPEHKLRIIEAFRIRDEVIAMTGDGVNDALSLVAADLGVAMGESGTEVAKEAADLIFLDDNFGNIVGAVEEGRGIFKNLKKVILYLFSTNVGEIMIIFGALFMGLPLPVLAAQLIWLNLVTDGFLDIALAMEPKDKGLLKEKYVKPNRWIVDGWMSQRMIIMASTMAIGTLFLFTGYLETEPHKAGTVALTIMAVYQWFKAWNCRSDKISIFKMNFFSNKFLLGATCTVIILQIAAVYTPFLQTILRTVPLAFSDWMIILSIALSTIAADEIAKMVKNKFGKKPESIEVLRSTATPHHAS